MNQFRILFLAFLLCQMNAQGVLATNATPPPSPNTNIVIVTNGTFPTVPPTTTSSTTTSTTTTRPTTTTTTTTTPPPPKPPVFPDNVGNWNVSSEDNVTCIILAGALQISFHYNITNKTETVDIAVPVSASAKGNCGELSQHITLSWGDHSKAINNLTFHFVFNKTDAHVGEAGRISPNNYALEEIQGLLYYEPKVNGSKGELVAQEFLIQDLNTFQTPQNNSYMCMSLEALKEKDDKDKHDVQVKLERLKLEAFRHSADSKFSTARQCSLDGYVTDIVPIAVGIALACLVLIVLIAYLVGRRRSRARGYQSV